MKKAKGKIHLHRETLHHLDAADAARAWGGVVTVGPNTCQTSCNPDTGCGMCWWSAVTK